MSVVTDLEKSLVKLNNTTYDSVDKLMKKVAKDNEISATELHHKFKAKHNMIPDDWIKTQMQEGNLHKWFKGSKSKDGKSGWVNVVTGGTCASDKPGEGTPKCVSSSKRDSMTPAERKSAQRRKKKLDPNQQAKSGAAKPTYVSTDKPKKKMKEETFNEARKPGESPQAYADRMKKKFAGGKSKTYDPMKDKNFDHDKAERTRGSMQEAEDKKTKGSGTKDACYSKVKSRYSVWPSAYASGALVKCRKVGAANWGNSTKKEGMEGFYDLPELTETQIGALKYAGYEVEVISEACWKGYEKKGMKTMFGKKYPNCVKKEEVEEISERKYSSSVRATYGGKTETFPVEIYKKKSKKAEVKKEEVTGGILVQDAGDFKPREIESVDIIKADPIKGGQLQEVVRTKPQTGNMYQVIFGWRGKMMMVKLFFPDASVPNRQKVANALDKMYPGSQLRSYSISIVDYDDPYINVGVDEETHLQEKKEEKKYCRLCEKKETRSQCGYGPKMFDKYSVDDTSDQEKSEAASEAGITEENVQEDEMKGLTVKSGHKRSVKQGAGLTQKGVDAVNRKTGGNLKTAVTTPPSKLKPGSKAAGRRKSFCARSKSWKGERGLAARRRWNC